MDCHSPKVHIPLTSLKEYTLVAVPHLTDLGKEAKKSAIQHKYDNIYHSHHNNLGLVMIRQTMWSEQVVMESALTQHDAVKNRTEMPYLIYLKESFGFVQFRI